MFQTLFVVCLGLVLSKPRVSKLKDQAILLAGRAGVEQEDERWEVMNFSFVCFS